MGYHYSVISIHFSEQVAANLLYPCSVQLRLIPARLLLLCGQQFSQLSTTLFDADHKPLLALKRKPKPLILASLREVEVDTLTSQTLVDLGVSVKTVVDTAALLLVENDFQNLAAVLLGAQTLTDNLDWVDEIGENGVVHRSQGAGTWALLGLAGAAAVAALWAGQDAARGDDEDVAVGEFLLELTCEAVCEKMQFSDRPRLGEEEELSFSRVVLTAAGSGAIRSGVGRGRR